MQRNFAKIMLLDNISEPICIAKSGTALRDRVKALLQLHDRNAFDLYLDVMNRCHH